jgi:diguanylate cyclase (GGDEF)-like protein
MEELAGLARLPAVGGILILDGHVPVPLAAKSKSMHPRLQRGNRLPSLPTVAVEILRLFNTPDASIQELTETVQTDPALAIRILKAANSPRYGARGEITDLRMGIARLGRNNLTPLVLSFSLASTSLKTTDAAEHYKQIWLRCFVQATAAEIIAATHGPTAAAECFTINLLAGIGRLAMLKADAELYSQCIDQTAESNRPFCEIAEQLFGTTPLALSIDILHDIGLPERRITAVRCLENAELKADLQSSDAQIVAATRTADAVARYLCDENAAVGLLTLEEAISGSCDEADQTVEGLLEAIHARLEESGSLFNIDPSRIPAPDELLESALEQLADFTSFLGTSDQDQVPSELLEENGRLKRRVQDLIRETSVDALTGIYNRGWFNTHMSEVQAISRINDQEFGVAIIDIDRFKLVNDTHGHQAGDHVLREVAQALNGVTRQDETIARYGGEEFVLLLENACQQGMAVVGERLRSQVEAATIEFEGKSIPVTVSVGIAHGYPWQNANFSQELFARADAALYEAKHNGRNRVVLDSSLAKAAVSLAAESSTGSVEAEPVN